MPCNKQKKMKKNGVGEVCADVDLLYRGTGPKVMTQCDIDKMVSLALAKGTSNQAELSANMECVVLQQNIMKKNKKKKKKLIFRVKRKNIAQYRDIPGANRLMMIRRMRMGKHRVIIIRFKSESSFTEMKKALQWVSTVPFLENDLSSPSSRILQTEADTVCTQALPCSDEIFQGDDYRQQPQQNYKTEQPIYIFQNMNSPNIQHRQESPQSTSPIRTQKSAQSPLQMKDAGYQQSYSSNEQSPNTHTFKTNQSPDKHADIKLSTDSQQHSQQPMKPELRKSRLREQKCCQLEHPIYLYKRQKSQEDHSLTKTPNHRKQNRRSKSQNHCLEPQKLYLVKRVHFSAKRDRETEVDRVTIYDCRSSSKCGMLHECRRSVSSVSASSISSSDSFSFVPLC